MMGFPLDMFNNPITHVPDDLTKNPNLTVKIAEILGPDLVERLKDHYGDIDEQEMGRRLPMSAFRKRFTFDQLCKIRYGTIFTMDRTVEEAFEDEPEYALMRKIQNSMWRWGSGSGVWNEVVDAYDAIRSFNIPVDDFEVRLDFTTYHNERGYSRESRTYLDGVFGFLVHYKGEHVMTLGFSIMDARRVLIQQIQLVKRKGNRFLFRLPANRVEFFLQCFAKSFPNHTLCMADGGDIANVSLSSYKRGLENVLSSIASYPSASNQEEKEYLEASITHLTADAPRLAALYADTGSYTKAGEFSVNGVRHYLLAA